MLVAAVPTTSRCCNECAKNSTSDGTGHGLICRTRDLSGVLLTIAQISFVLGEINTLGIDKRSVVFTGVVSGTACCAHSRNHRDNKPADPTPHWQEEVRHH